MAKKKDETAEKKGAEDVWALFKRKDVQYAIDLFFPFIFYLFVSDYAPPYYMYTFVLWAWGIVFALHTHLMYREYEKDKEVGEDEE